RLGTGIRGRFDRAPGLRAPALGVFPGWFRGGLTALVGRNRRFGVGRFRAGLRGACVLGPGVLGPARCTVGGHGLVTPVGTRWPVGGPARGLVRSGGAGARWAALLLLFVGPLGVG